MFFVSKDQNSICQLVARDLGPATQADPWAIACDGEVEWAQVLELADWAHRKHMELEARRAEVAPLRTAAMLAGVQSYYEEAARRATAQSTFGPYQRIQRD